VNRGWVSRAVFAVTLVLAGASSVAAQEAILSFTVEPRAPESAPGGQAWITVRIENESVRQADDIAISWSGPTGFVLDPVPQEVPVLKPFESVAVTLSIRVPESAEPGAVEGTLEFLYTYCIGELCFQIPESRGVVLGVVATTAKPVGDGADAGPPAAQPPMRRTAGGWIAYALVACAAVAVGTAALRARSGKNRRPLFAALALSAVAALAYGAGLGQHEQAQGIGAVLCTSCVGIEEARSREPQLSTAQASEIKRLRSSVELLVFYAPWCHACPYAEALVAQAASLNDAVTYRFVNVDEDPALAETYGVVRSGRAVVPAIVREGKDEVLFGIENLENRLVRLLTEGE